MFKLTLSLLMFLHGTIHLIGSAKGFGYEIPQITRAISPAIGSIWLITALLFIAASILLVVKKEGWYLIATMAIIASQILIILDWTDAKWGTIVNLIISLAVVVEFYNSAATQQ